MRPHARKPSPSSLNRWHTRPKSRSRSYQAVNNGFLWKSDEHLNHLAKIRYEHGDQLTDLPGVTGIGMGKDHIILYVSSDEVEVPEMVEDVHVVKVRRP